MLDFYTSDVRGQRSNVRYPHHIAVCDADSLRRAVANDYVCAEYRGGCRGNDNFLRSSCLAFDVDNDRSDSERDWTRPGDIIALFPEVTMAFHYSRNNMADKHYVNPATGEIERTVTARPRFHVFFEIDPVYSAQEYAALKKRAFALMPCFDGAALDSARFFFGTEDPEVLFHKGTRTLTDCLAAPPEAACAAPAAAGVPAERIPSGERNKTLSVYAAKVLKHYGDGERARELFRDKSRLCEPPLPESELKGIWDSAQKFYKRVAASPDYIPPAVYDVPKALPEKAEPAWEKPLPLGGEKLPPFPIEALPDSLRLYAEAVATSTQTPVDMAAVACLTTASACMRNLYKVEGKPDWHEPTNIYSVIIAEPSERKSAVISLTTKPVDEYVAEYNTAHRLDFEMSRAKKQQLENRKNTLLSQKNKKGAKPDTDSEELRSVLGELVSFEEQKPLRVYVDDTTPEKLTQVLAENNNAMSVISSEGGIFDILSGTYSNRVNIDVFLKAYSGENISVDRIMRESVCVQGACLTILLSVQPVVIGELMANRTFRHRGLTARFLYTTPQSFVGTRRLDSVSIPPQAYFAYRGIIRDILREQKRDLPRLIRLDSEAKAYLSSYYDLVEKMLGGELTMYADWLGKLVGNTLRIAGILARCSLLRRENPQAEVMIDGKTMKNAVQIGQYFLAHAINAYGDMGVRSDFKAAATVVDKIRKNHVTQVTRRDVMRMCRWINSPEEAQNIVGHLEDYGYIRLSVLDTSDKLRGGRPKNALYAVNPLIA